MPAPKNTFKAAIAAKRQQIGCWLALGESAGAELMATTGFDWLLIDGEHGPNDMRSIRDQLVAIAGSDSHPIVRLPIGETRLVKQALDLGAQTVLVPMVDTAEQARELVRACRYAPHGIRGMGGTGARVTGFGSYDGYVQNANDEICLLVQAESRAALDNLDDILAVEGVDGVFIGPADLSADMGFPGKADAPEVVAAIADAITRINASDKASGILTLSEQGAQTYIDMNVTFVAVGVDTLMLANTARAVSAKTKAMIKP
ncbi:HpcH/HpaI aldolase family protein [Shimia abyssi]|uniref:Hydroxypyruvate/pyruvate aldolase n=1 Tax=Shimia abyssi TaxID=1662395 RepID=A0A2P8F890_9RHOB|nr:HpcH/HpaI aldolase/citrate lyase family protein [Shimia abyssi]PSL17892.1 2,4-dihydroxyhept-2-enedioate aldolase [Shimia abyssi]